MRAAVNPAAAVVVALPAVVIEVVAAGAAVESATADSVAARAVVARQAAVGAARQALLPAVAEIDRRISRSTAAARAREIRGPASQGPPNPVVARPFNRSPAQANRDRESPAAGIQAAANRAAAVPRSNPCQDLENRDPVNPDQKRQDRESRASESRALVSLDPKNLVPENPGRENRDPGSQDLENPVLKNPAPKNQAQGRDPADLEDRTTAIGPADRVATIVPETDPAGLATDRAMTTNQIGLEFHPANVPAVREIVLRFNPFRPAGPIDRAIGPTTAIVHRVVLPVIRIAPPADVRRTGTGIGRTCITFGTTGTGTAIGITAARIGTPIRGAPGALPPALSASPPG